jgi:hypothetical protein
MRERGQVWVAPAAPARGMRCELAGDGTSSSGRDYGAKTANAMTMPRIVKIPTKIKFSDKE